ncbi:MAG: cytochrome c [Cellvibrionaceae bacterium]|nr:cytochrome c [Cellvibrionaceae bacterium]
MKPQAYLLCSFLALFASAQADADKALSQTLNTCATCHGAKGISIAEQWPNLAGQKPGYLAAQIRHIRDGVRSEPTMQPFVKNLSDEQIEALAAHYASLPAAKHNHQDAPEAGKRVRAHCVSCHGTGGITVNSLWPNLAGQKKAYIIKQLQDYRSGKRKHPIMAVIASELNEQQIKDVAAYFSQQ